ncbi:MAG: hypothetical protein M3299_01615 [Thermoproteota archaeon]|nr:hypothetical protein [Thermoproteota archaeon]
MSVTGITAIMFLVLISASPSLSVLSLLHQPQQAEASLLPSSSRFVPSAYIIVDGKASKLQLENDPLGEDTIADYSRPPQGTISFGERFGLLVPQFSGIFKNAQSARLMICSDEGCGNDDFHVRQELVNSRDARYWYLEIHTINAPGGVGDGFTVSEVGFKTFLYWKVSFTDGTEQTYLAIVHLKGDPCQEHGWVYHSSTDTTCIDPNF